MPATDPMHAPYFECVVVTTVVQCHGEMLSGTDEQESVSRIVRPTRAALLEQMGAALRAETPVDDRDAYRGYTTVSFGPIREVVLLAEGETDLAEVRATAVWQAHLVSCAAAMPPRRLE